MEVFGRELTIEEIINFVRMQAPITRKHCDCHDCLFIDMALELADEVEKFNRRAAPENKALTLAQLRQMDGEPVWIVEAPDWGHWEVSEHAEDYLDDRDPDFYGMKHDDPAGRYGLHVLGWLAYARKPEGNE